ncbi:MAG: hypothetical protein OXE17_07405 [Chloroflexi bacterium]|nr:hypothetical protein [Chloroflexota bacterium]
MTMTQDERISRLEGAFEAISVMVANMVTRDELRAGLDGHRAELRAGLDGHRAETRALIEGLRNEMRAEVKSVELRIVRWIIATAFAGATLIIGSISAILFTAIRLMT